MIWFLNPFWEIYGERLKEYKINKDFIMFLKPLYEDVNDYDFYLSSIKMKDIIEGCDNTRLGWLDPGCLDLFFSRGHKRQLHL